MENEWFNKISKMITEEEPSFIKRKNQYLPKYLVKYYRVSENSIESLKNDTVWFDKPLNYNDPYDCSITITGELVRTYIEQKIADLECKVGKLDSINKNELYDFQFSEFVDRLNEHIKNSCLISCFSTEVDSMLMWSHYADSHKGFCLVYDISEIDANNMIRKNLYSVIYNENKFDIGYYLNRALEPKYPFIASLCWKSKEWSYENEYRIVLPCSEVNCKPQLYNFIKPIQIFLGSNINKEDKDKIENLGIDRGIKVNQMSCNAQKYSLISRELLWKRRE